MAVITIHEDDLVRKDPQDSKVYCFDWDGANLSPTAQVSSQTFTITEITPTAAWSATVSYRVGDQALSAGTIYQCLLAHTNQVPPNATYWSVVSADAPLTKDNEAILTAAQASSALQRTVTGDNRVTRLRLIAGTLGHVYEVANKITSTETPPQIKERSFRVLIEQL